MANKRLVELLQPDVVTAITQAVEVQEEAHLVEQIQYEKMEYKNGEFHIPYEYEDAIGTAVGYAVVSFDEDGNVNVSGI